jgi:Cd2+/Zn2+-exporting ATPase
MQLHEEHGETCLTCNFEYSKDPISIWKDKRILLTAVSIFLFTAGVVFEFALKLSIFAVILYATVTILLGHKIAREGLSTLFYDKRLNIDFLMIVAALGSFLIGHAEEGASVILLFYIAEFLEDHASDRARSSIMSLMKLTPDTATVKREGNEVKEHVHNIDVNEIIVVRPGEKIPLDGEVVRGLSSVNQASITGESMPIMRGVGDIIYAGTLNNEGFLEIKVTKRSDETMLRKIVQLVEEAQKIKSPSEKFIDKFAKYYTPSVLLLAACVAIIPNFLFGLSFNEWIYRALVLLVVSCPCALAISTPVAMISSLTNAARNGVLIKGSAYIENISKIKVFAFDKTGTLTEGQLEVTDVVGFGHSKEEVLIKAACSEALSEHPIAKAIVDTARKEGVILRDVSNFRAVTGKGVTCEINGEKHKIGSRQLFEDLTTEFSEEQVKKLQNEGKTVVLVGNEKEIIGVIAVMDKIREDTIESIKRLRRMGMRTEMITGDNKRTAEIIAHKIGIDEYHAELLPDEKVSMIGNHLSNDYGNVAMVGDGVNDAPALAKASVGIAMGAAGSDVALETADVALMRDDLSKLPYLLELSKKTMKVVKQNIIISIIIKTTFAILAFPGLMTLWLAVAIGDMGLSLAVILNSMRLSLTKS